MVKHAKDAPLAPSLRTELPIPEAVDRLVLACLEKDPDRRPRSAAILMAELDALALEEPWTEAAARHWWNTYRPVVR